MYDFKTFDINVQEVNQERFDTGLELSRAKLSLSKKKFKEVINEFRYTKMTQDNYLDLISDLNTLRELESFYSIEHCTNIMYKEIQRLENKIKDGLL